MLHLGNILQSYAEEHLKKKVGENNDKKIQEYADSQPYYGHCTTEYLEGIEQGAKWLRDQLLTKTE